MKWAAKMTGKEKKRKKKVMLAGKENDNHASTVQAGRRLGLMLLNLNGPYGRGGRHGWGNIALGGT